MDLCFRINSTHPQTEEYKALVKELFRNGFGEGSRIVLLGDKVIIGKNVISGFNLTAMFLVLYNYPFPGWHKKIGD